MSQDPSRGGPIELGESDRRVIQLLKAASFAAEKHRDQRRKDMEASPYVNHPLQVARLLAEVGHVTNLPLLLAALLHDTIEDTDATPEELAGEFGEEVTELVLEVTDDKQLAKAVRKQLQVEQAPHKSPRAKLLKIADKICNLRDLNEHSPADWPTTRKQQYVDWAEQVVAGCRGGNPALDQLFDQTVAEVRARFAP